jgi:hypothetical protein
LCPGHGEGETGNRSRGWPGPCTALSGRWEIGSLGLLATPSHRCHQRSILAMGRK